MSDTLSPFLREYWATDRLCDVAPHIVLNNYQCSVNIIKNPTQFPKANFEFVGRLVDEIFNACPAVATGDLELVRTSIASLA